MNIKSKERRNSSSRANNGFELVTINGRTLVNFPYTANGFSYAHLVDPKDHPELLKIVRRLEKNKSDQGE